MNSCQESYPSNAATLLSLQGMWSYGSGRPGIFEERRDTRIYDINRLLEVYDPLSLNPEPMDIPRPKAHDLNVMIKALITKEIDG